MVKEQEIESIIIEIENSEFIKNISDKELNKIFNPEKKKSNWRFIIINDKIKPLKIIELVQHCCKTRAFVNKYKHSSIHTHSNYPAIAEFKRMRGKLISNEYTDPIIMLAIHLTCLFISDICEIDKNAKKKLDELPNELSNFIIGMSKSIKGNSYNK